MDYGAVCSNLTLSRIWSIRQNRSPPSYGLVRNFRPICFVWWLVNPSYTVIQWSDPPNYAIHIPHYPYYILQETGMTLGPGWKQKLLESSIPGGHSQPRFNHIPGQSGHMWLTKCSSLKLEQLLCKNFVPTICIPQLASWLCFYLLVFLHKMYISTINLE